MAGKVMTFRHHRTAGKARIFEILRKQQEQQNGRSGEDYWEYKKAAGNAGLAG